MFSRREFITATGGIVCTSLVSPAFAASSGSTPLELSASRRRSLMAALEKEDANYDPAANMVRIDAGGPGYHTRIKTGKVHGTRASLAYASALLDSGEPARLDRAKEILRKVVLLQDQKPSSKTYGIWSWYLEEPLDKMAPPDWNWADFCGVQLLHAWIHHRDRLGAELSDAIRSAILHAARSIERRNVALSYTNIAIMGTYVTLVAGAQFNDDAIQQYAKDRLRRFHKFTMDQGSLTEYNSPTYTIVAVSELSRMLLHVQAPEDRKIIQELHDFAWKHIATHFHAPTRQWAGPHSRCYSDDLRKRGNTLGLLEEATGVDLVSEDPLPLGLDHYRLPLKCPPELVGHFSKLDSPRTTIKTFSKANPERRGGRNPIAGTTYLHPKFTFGTVNRGDLWNQRRPVLAYWGTPDQPRWMRVRFLHDGYDYTSALICAAQHEGSAVVTVSFATDYGDTHPNLDLPPARGQIKAKDLRLRFEFGGSVDALQTVVKETYWTAEDDALHVLCKWSAESFGAEKIRWEESREGDKRCIDRVVYSGAARTFDFNKLRDAYFTFGVYLLPAERKRQLPTPFSLRSWFREDLVHTLCHVGNATLMVSASAKPAPLAAANDAAVAASGPFRGLHYMDDPEKEAAR